MKNRKKLILSVSLLTALALFAGCSTASAVSPEPSAAAVQAPAFLRLDEVKAIAYAHAGVSEAEATDRSYDFDDGAYEIEFSHDGWEYDYLVSLEGKVLRSHREKDDDHHHSKATQPTQSNESRSDRISAEKALSIALNHAGVTDARDRDVEWDDGRWEVSFESGRTEYEYHISASGSILRWEKEQDD